MTQVLGSSPSLKNSRLVANSGKRILILLFLLLLCFAEFVIRGPLRALQPNVLLNDFMSPYLQSKAWGKGMDPYDPRSLSVLWPHSARRPEFLDREITSGSLLMNRGIPTAYPPPCLALIAPLTYISWPLANTVWTGINVLSILIALTALCSIAGLPWREARNYVFMAVGLAFAPFHTGIAVGNIAILATASSILAMWAIRNSMEIRRQLAWCCHMRQTTNRPPLPRLSTASRMEKFCDRNGIRTHDNSCCGNTNGYRACCLGSQLSAGQSGLIEHRYTE